MTDPVDPGERGGAPAVEAARAASRIATAHRDVHVAQRQARNIADTTLTAQGLTCTQLTVTLDTSGFTAPLGTPGLVRAEVRCTLRWSDLALPGAPGSRTVRAAFSSPVDRFRERDR